MFRLIFWRLVQLPFILLVVFLITFALAWMLPGNPLERDEGKRPPPEVQEAMRKQYNLDNPAAFMIGYVRGVFFGTVDHPAPYFGPSLQYRDQTVNEIISSSLPVSVRLGLLALIVALFIGTIAGVLGALRPRSALDVSSLTVALVGISLPSFVTGAILLVVFAGLLRVFPIGGWGTVWHMVLPSVALGLAPAAYIARLIRLGLADIMSSDYIRTAQAKGLSRDKALFKHALKVAYLPVLSFLGPAAAVTMTGSFVVEQVFNIPGMGEHFVNAVVNKDQFLILGLVLVFATILVLFNLVVDVAYAWIDPRIEL